MGSAPELHSLVTCSFAGTSSDTSVAGLRSSLWSLHPGPVPASGEPCVSFGPGAGLCLSPGLVSQADSVLTSSAGAAAEQHGLHLLETLLTTFTGPLGPLKVRLVKVGMRSRSTRTSSVSAAAGTMLQVRSIPTVLQQGSVFHLRFSGRPQNGGVCPWLSNTGS